MTNEEYDVLAIDEEHQPIIVEEECEALKPIVKDFVQTYAQNADAPVESWLGAKMQEYLPEKSDKEIKSITDGIIATLKVNEQKSKSLSEAIKNGRSKESWFASEMKQVTSAMSAQEASQYLAGLDSALNTANESLYRTITTQAGNISQNPRLDGFIAEQYHAQTFNLNAEATGSQYRAKVLEPNGNGYAKNSVDIVIVDGNGKIVKRYQSKYCKNANATAQAFENGDYRGQQKLVPQGQETAIEKKCTTVIEAPDGTTSNPLSKSKAEQMRDEAQSGNWKDLNWNEYKAKDLAMGIGKQAGYAALQGAAIGVGFDVAQKLWNGEEIKGEEIVETALISGADSLISGADSLISGADSKSKAEQMRDEAQSGNWKDLNWNEYKAKDLAMGIGKQAGYAALQGAAIGVGFDVAQKLWNGEEIKGEEIVKTALISGADSLISGADFGVKAAGAGALKVGVEKNIIKVIPKGTPASTIANIAHVAIEDIEIVGKMVTSELSFKEGVDKIEQTAVATAAGLAAMDEGAAIGGTIGTVFGPVGTAIGGFIGGTVGYMAGSKVGENVVKGVQKFCEKTKEVVKTAGSVIESVASKAVSGFESFCSGVCSAVESLFSW